MPPFLSASKAIGKLLSRAERPLDVRRLLTWSGKSGGKLGQFVQVRCLSSIVGTQTPSVHSLIDADKDLNLMSRNLRTAIQTRWFLGCGDGEEGNVLSKTYEERRVIGYSAEQLFAVVAAVDLYEDFVPWCQRSQIVTRNEDGSFDAELEIGFKFLVESYISHVELKKPKSIKVASLFFKEVVSRLVGSFSDRCRMIYGPGVQVLENSYGQRI
ncbi:uncharacterized protein LOC143881504 isoform X2 [Tasmannia lanceolata]|uniref:uncharacterized protein LOC143881504 isoform X2 n=1 Tax=Tasmannia lanceolata TaxID=3420 RepID=UPI0040629F5C